MTAFSKFLVLFSSSVAVSNALAPASSVQNVISILNDMSVKVTKDKEEGIKLNDDQENECIETTTAGKAEIKRQTDIRDESAARVEAAEAQASGYNAEHRDLTTAVANKKEEQQTNNGIFKEESTNIAKELAEMTETRDMLVQAYQVLKRHMSMFQSSKHGSKLGFLQKKDGQDIEKVKSILTGLSAIVNAAWVDNQSATTINKFLKDPAACGAAPVEGPEDEFEMHPPVPVPGGEEPVPAPEGDMAPVPAPEGSDEPAAPVAFVQSPQATVTTYEANAGTKKILQTVSQLQVQAESQIDDLKKRQMTTKHNHEMFTQDANNLIASKSEQADSAKNSAAQASSSAQDSGNKNQQATALLADEVSKLREKVASCAKSAADWADLKQEMEDEFSVLGQAVEILSGKFAEEEPTSFVQIRRHIQRNSATSAASLLRQLGEKFDNFGFVQAASKLDSGDPFAKVKDLINNMIAKLEKEQKEEADFEAQCKTDLAKGKSDKAKKESSLAKLQSRLKGKKAKHLSLDSQITETTARIQQIEEEQAQSTVVYNEMQTADKAIVEEATSAIEALDQAIMTLQEFYGEKIMVTAPVSLAQFGSTKSTAKGETVIKVLAQAQADYLQIKSKTEEKLRHDKSKYEEDSSKNKLSLARHKTELEAKQSQKTELGVVIQEVNTDLNNAEIELNAAAEYLSGVNERCANKPMSFEERQQRRGDEIAGLNQALEILSEEGA